MHSALQRFFRERPYSPYTVRSYTYWVGRLGEWMKQNQVGASDLDGTLFEIFLADQGKLSDNSCYAAYCAARAFWGWMFGPRHPFGRYHRRRGKTPPQRFLTRAAVGRLLASFDTSSLAGARNLALVTLALDTGFREAELCHLETARLSLFSRTADVICKGSVWGRGYFSRYTASCLSGYLARVSDLRRCPQVFVSVKRPGMGAALTPCGLRCIIERVGRKAGLGLISPHDLRRTFAQLASKNRATGRVLQIAGRWKTAQMVDYYTRNMEIDADEWERFSPVNYVMGLES